MIHSEYNWKSFDGLNYYAQMWSNNNKPKAIISLIHGIGEHSSRYEDWAKYFVSNDFFVLTFDYRGHGKSEGKRGHIPNYEASMKDIDLIIDKSNEMFPDIPKFLYGHSLGGNFVINYLISRKNINIYGAIVTSPWLKLAFNPPKTQLKLAKLLKNIFPSYTQSSGLKVEHISRDSNVVEKYKTDSLVHKKISIQLFIDAYQKGLFAYQNATKVDKPILLLHGNSDNITSHKASYEFSRKNIKKITFKLWEGCYHELHNEINKVEVADFIITWVNQQLINYEV